MWPMLLDMTKEESVQHLRNLELEAYSHLISALRAQGPLSPDKRKLLKETGVVLNISQDRHKAEVRRAVSDEKLNTIAYHISGENDVFDDWIQEGRRTCPILPRVAPQTAYSSMADEVADSANKINKELPPPSATERRRPIVQQITQPSSVESTKAISYRMPDALKLEQESKKRKMSVATENSSLAQHLLGPSKMSKIQQLYRQRSKAKVKEMRMKYKQEEKQDYYQHRPPSSSQLITQKVHQLSKMISQPSHIPNGPKINVLQNISIQAPAPDDQDVMVNDNENLTVAKPVEQNTSIASYNENQAPRPKILQGLKTNTNVTFKQLPPSVSSTVPSSDLQKTLKMSVCTPRKPISKPITPGQKLIVVSNTQTIPTTSILQRTLTIPFMKNISVKNFEKFKIVSTTPTSTNNIQVTSVATATQLNSAKHKVVTLRTNPTVSKKVIPLSQLQMLNSKGGIKVLPVGSKIIGKTTIPTTSSVFIMNTGTVPTSSKITPSVITSALSNKTIEPLSVQSITVSEVNSVSPLSSDQAPSSPRENGKYATLDQSFKNVGSTLINNAEQRTEDKGIIEHKNVEEMDHISDGSSNKLEDKLENVDVEENTFESTASENDEHSVPKSPCNNEVKNEDGDTILPEPVFLMEEKETKDIIEAELLLSNVDIKEDKIMEVQNVGEVETTGVIHHSAIIEDIVLDEKDIN